MSGIESDVLVASPQNRFSPPSQIRHQSTDSKTVEMALNNAQSKIQAADRLVKEALKNIPEEGSTEQTRRKLKNMSSAQTFVSQPRNLNLPPPQTNFQIQQQQLQQTHPASGFVPYNLSEEEMSQMLALGVTPEELHEINQLLVKANKDGGNAEIMNLVNALTEDELDALAEMTDSDLEKVAEMLAIPPAVHQTGNQLEVVQRTRRGTGSKELRRKRSVKKTVEEKLEELQKMVDRLETTKSLLLNEMQDIRSEALGIVDETSHKSRRSTKETAERKPEGIVSRIQQSQDMLDLYKKAHEPQLSTEQIKELAAAMKSMIDMMENKVKHEIISRKRRRRDTGEDAVKPAAGSQFSFLEFGSDDQGFYKTFKPKTKRSLKEMFLGGEQDTVERVVPTYTVPDFVPDPQFSSGIFTSRELVTPPNLKPVVQPTRRRRSESNPGVKKPSSNPSSTARFNNNRAFQKTFKHEPSKKDIGVNEVDQKAGGVITRMRRHLEYLFSSEEPEEDLLYFGVNPEESGVLKYKYEVSSPLLSEDRDLEDSQSDHVYTRDQNPQDELSKTLSNANMVKQYR
ncbi:uncharacterized protein LOC111712510 [Eurytemora carolleeae]|uniref:uncharacterized protein LOC111712510 n=1 Tax=Eurytemora carolleeae TaxID=1294199 RepID=UPI000C77D221|nr:uncharacterized protein LOC111712510 [Eurytemora carolleeae]|eukprot:XP_023342913.1 uncharacterized protein LOC111712510 [Eurytemora affinis]